MIAASNTSNVEQIADTITIIDATEPIVESSSVPSIESTYENLPTSELVKLLERPVFKGRIEWSSSTGSKRLLYASQPHNDMMKNPTWAFVLQRYRYVRFSLRLRFDVVMNPYQSGCLLASTQPYARALHARYSDIGFYIAASSNPSLYNPQDSSTLVLDLPYLSDLPYYDTLDLKDDHTWQAFLYVASPLDGPTNNEQVTINYWYEPYDVELSLPRFQGNDEAEKKVERGFVSSTLETVSSVAGALSAIPPLSAIAGPVSWLADGAGRLASAFGFSKPTIVPTPNLTYSIFTPYSNSIDGVDTSQKLALTTGNQVAQLGTDDEMSLEMVARRWGFLANRHMAGDTLGNTWSTDFSLNHTIVAGAPATFYRSPVSFLALFFDFWRADLTYTFHFIKNKFVAGKVVVYYNDVPVSENDLGQVRSKVFDLASGNSFSFTVPYMAAEPMLSWADTRGSIYLDVLSKFTDSEGVVQIPYFVTISASNVSFGGYSPALPRVADAMFPPVAQGLDPEVIGENVTSLRALTRRATFLGVYDLDRLILNAQIPTFGKVTDPGKATIFDYLYWMFGYWRGSVRYKASSKANLTIQRALTKQPNLTANTDVASGFHRTYAISSNGTVEAEFPFYSKTRMKRMDDAGFSYSCERDGASLVHLRFSVGDDASFHSFCMFPLLSS